MIGQIERTTVAKAMEYRSVQDKNEISNEYEQKLRQLQEEKEQEKREDI